MTTDLHLKIKKARLIRRLQNYAGYLWRAACAQDGISQDAVFVSFSTDNPYLAPYNKTVRLLQGLRNPQRVTL